MTDSHLMDADCIHGVVWFECATCLHEMAEIQEQEAAAFLRERGWTVIPPNVGGIARVYE